jgi:hypothetical protein
MSKERRVNKPRVVGGKGGEGWPIPPLFVPRWSPAENEGSKPKPKYGFVEGKKRFQLCFVRNSPRALIDARLSSAARTSLGKKSPA